MKEPRPINRVEISEKNKTLRLIAAVLLLVIGVIGITTGIMSLLNKETGWQRVQVAPQERNCSESFLLQYKFTGTGAEATAVNNKLQTAYGEACVKAYQLFTPDEAIDGVQNIYYVNHHPNEVVAVDPVLYAAFEKVADMPWIYLGPAYAHYSSMIFNTEENLLPELDPMENPEAAAYVAAVAEFAADRNSVNLELLGDHKVRLSVSQAYLEFAEEEEIENFIDFAYLTNAFIIDYLAQVLIDEDLTDGYLVSADGFTRNLVGDQDFSVNIFDRVGNTVYPAGVLGYRGPISIVYLKDYTTGNSDVNYRETGNRFVHLMTDPADGIYRTAEENLVSYSYDTGCADVLLKMLPGFVGSEFVVPEGVFSVWCEGEMICYNDASVSIGNLLKSEQMTYRAVYKG